jgi:hypothetical protein
MAGEAFHGGQGNGVEAAGVAARWQATRTVGMLRANASWPEPGVRESAQSGGAEVGRHAQALISGWPGRGDLARAADHHRR